MPRTFRSSPPSIWKRPQDWPFEPSGHYFVPHAAQILLPDVSGDLREIAASCMRRKLADGELRAVALLGDGRLVPIQSNAWVVNENFDTWFSTCQITNFDLFGSGVHPLAGVTHLWIFIEKAGLDAILSPPSQPDHVEEEREESRPISYPRQISLESMKAKPFLFLGEVIEWIISREQPGSSADIAAKWDVAERELFDLLDAGTVDVQGYRAPDRPRIHESLPRGIWARMNKGGGDDPMFSPVDDSEEREDGGSVFVADLRWDGVRLPTSFVLKHWPPSGESAEGPKARGRRPRYDWKSFGEAALAKLDEEGAFDPSVDTQWNKAACERYMAGWCRENWGTEPGESTIRSKLSEIEAAHLEGRKSQ